MSKITWATLTVTFVVRVVCCILLWMDCWKLVTLRMGEMRAASPGG